MIPLSQVQQTLESAGLVHGLAVSEIHARLAKGLRLHDTGQRILAFYLTEMEEGRLYQATSHGSTAHYAELRLGLDRRRTSELIAVGRKLLTLPAIDHAFCKQQIAWSKVLLLVSVATPEHEEEWLAHARKATCRKLALAVRLARPGGPPRAPGDMKGLPEIRYRHTAMVGALTHRKLERAKEKLSAELGHAVNEAEMLDVMAENFLTLEEDGTVPGRTRVSASLYRIVLHTEEGGDGFLVMDTDDGPVPIEGSECIGCDGETVPTADGKEREIAPKTPPWLRNRVLARDGYRCRSCGSRHRLMVHHIHWRSKGGPTRASNLVVTCVVCHGLLHAGLLVIEGEDAARIRFVDSAGRPLSDPGPQAGTELDLAGPPPDPIARSLVPAEPAPQPVTLATLPDVVDGAWWRRHSHRMRFGPQGLELHGGSPLPESEAAPAAENESEPVPFAEAFAEVVGQDALVRRIEMVARGSEARGKTFPHTLLTGPGGTGKTNLAHRLAACLGRRLVKAVGPLLQNVFLLVRLLADLRERDFLFVEEVHAAARPVVEALYEAMAERTLSLTVHSGASARTVRFDLPPFTLVAATTEEGELPTPFLSRFGLRESLGYYARDDLAEIVTRTARAQGFTVAAEAARHVADLARGTPRGALRLLDRVLDDAAGREVDLVGRGAVEAVLATLGYDREGLEPSEQRYRALLRRSAVPVPLARLSQMLGTSARTVVRETEPHLFREGLVRTTSRGRVAVRRPRVSGGSLSGRTDRPGSSSPAALT